MMNMELEQQRRTSKIIFNQALNQNHKSNQIKKGEGPHTEAPTAETIYDSQGNILSFTLLCSLKKLKTSLIDK